MSKLIDRVNAEFRRVLEQHPDPHAVYRELSDGMVARGCHFGSGPMPLYVKPYFIESARMPEIRRTTEVLARVMNKVADLYDQDDRWRPLFHLSPQEAELAGIAAGYEPRVQITRNDAFMTDDSLTYIEFNADCAGGPMFSDAQGDLIQQSAPFAELRRSFAMSRDLVMWQLLRTLLTCYRQWGGNKELPNICITAGPGGGMAPEFHAIINWLRSMNFNAEFVSTTEWTYENGHLRAPGGMEPDIIYRRGWITNWTHHMDGIRPIVGALRDHKVCLVNPLSSILAANKSIFAVLQMPEVQGMLEPDERDIIRNHLPWTRVFEAAKAEFHGRTVDLPDFVLAHRARFVLKPIDQFGGKDVVVGFDTTDADWAAWCDRACAPQGRFVVQEVVGIPEEEFPVFDGETLRFARKKVNVSFYGCGGIYAGGVVRSSDSSVINVHQGGGQTPIVFVDERPQGH